LLGICHFDCPRGADEKILLGRLMPEMRYLGQRSEATTHQRALPMVAIACRRLPVISDAVKTMETMADTIEKAQAVRAESLSALE
jgi:hypothetical protein